MPFTITTDEVRRAHQKASRANNGNIPKDSYAAGLQVRYPVSEFSVVSTTGLAEEATAVEKEVPKGEKKEEGSGVGAALREKGSESNE